MFRFYSCRFRAEKYKETCARLTINKQFHIPNCYTLECSAFGYFSRESRSSIQFKEADLIEFGKNIAEAVLEQALIVERDEKIKKAIEKRIEARRGGGANKRNADSPTKQQVVQQTVTKRKEEQSEIEEEEEE